MKKLLFLFILLFAGHCLQAQFNSSDTLKLGKRQVFLGACSKAGKGVLTIVQNDKEDCINLVFYDDNFEKKWEKKVLYKTFDYSTSTSRPYFLFADNYLYMFTCYIPSAWMTPMKQFRADKVVNPDLIFAPEIVQISYDGKMKENKLQKELEINYADSYVDGDNLILCLSKQENNLKNHYFFVNIDPSDLTSSRPVKIIQPGKLEGWTLNKFTDSLAYFAGMDTKGYTGRNNLPGKTVNGTLYALMKNGKTKKELVFEHTSDKFFPCPDYHYDHTVTSGNIRYIYLVESGLANIAVDSRNNCFYLFGLLTDDERGPFHKQGLYLDKYKLNGKKYFSKEYGFMDFKPRCKEIDDELCDHGMTNANHWCFLYTDKDEILFMVPRLGFGYVFSFLMNTDGEMKKVVYGRGSTFGIYGLTSFRTNGETDNFKTNFYSYSTYQDGDDNSFKNLDDIRNRFKSRKREVSLNLFKLGGCYVIGAYNEKDNYIAFYKYTY